MSAVHCDESIEIGPVAERLGGGRGRVLIRLNYSCVFKELSLVLFL
jgi:hypothetical protein